MPLDIAEAAHWLKRAADAGIIAGQVEYAIMLFNGVGVEKDEAEAAKIFLAAAPRQSDRAEPSRASLCRPARAAQRSGQGRRLAQLRQSGRLEDDGLDVATANLTPDERSRFTKMVHELAGF